MSSMPVHAFLGCPSQIPPKIQDLAQVEINKIQSNRPGQKEASDKVVASRDLKALQNVASIVTQKKAKEVYLIGQGILGFGKS